MGEKNETKKAELCILRHGLNGNGTFSLIHNGTRAPIITNKKAEEIASHIVRVYPEIAERIVDADQIFRGSETGDIDFLVEPSDKESLVLSIVQKFKAQRKTEKTNRFQPMNLRT